VTRARPSILTAFILAYWDFFHALRMMWRSTLIALVIAAIGLFATSIVPLLWTHDPIGQSVTRQIFLIGLCFFLTPFLLAIHRFVLLGEMPKGYDIEPTRRRFQLFFGWFAISALLVTIPSFIDDLTAARDPFYNLARAFAHAGPSTLVTASRLAVFVMAQHFLLLFPAVAVDAPGATWQNAIRDTQNRPWFFLGAIILPFIPIGLLGMMVAPLLRLWPGTLIGVIVTMLWFGGMLVVALTLAAVIASRLYQSLGDRLNT
jgi:hypothetical protein